MPSHQKNPIYYSKQKDKNYPEIAAALEGIIIDGVPVQVIDTNGAGMGFPDAMALHPSKPWLVILFEVKRPGKTFTDKEVKWHANFKGLAFKVETGEEARRIFMHYWNQLPDISVIPFHTSPAPIF